MGAEHKLLELRTKTLQIAQGEAAVCQECDLHTCRTKSVFARGNQFGEVMFVGEAPGESEDLTGEPFVGPAGEIFDKYIKGMKLIDGDYYVCNAVKCRTPNNKAPTQKQMDACNVFLQIQIRLVQPKIIIALGRAALTALCGNSNTNPVKWRGVWQETQVPRWNPSGVSVPGEVDSYPVIATYHPAYILRDPACLNNAGKDLYKALERLGRVGAK